MVERVRGVHLRIDLRSLAEPFIWQNHGEKPFVYLHVFDWPESSQLEVPSFTGRVAQITVLGDKRKLRFRGPTIS